MPIAISLLPGNVDGSASNFVYAVATLTFSGNYPTGGDTLDFTTVADKLPSAPSRLEPAGLGGRVVLAAAAGAVLARGAKDPLLPAVVVAAAAALLSARIGHDVRAAASKRVPPAAAATAEDMVALGLAAASARS